MRGIENARRRSQRIDGRINTDLGQGTRKNRRGVEVSERRCRSGIGQIVGGHVDRLHGGDRTFLRGCNALLQFAHFGGEVRLVSDGGGHTTQERGYFRSSLRETENVVDEEERVTAFFVAEKFGNGQSRESDAEAGAGRLGHLAIDESGF
jgi:hypothetical protein